MLDKCLVETLCRNYTTLQSLKTYNIYCAASVPPWSDNEPHYPCVSTVKTNQVPNNLHMYLAVLPCVYHIVCTTCMHLS